MNEFWTPDQRWAGQDVFIVGGGPSLRGFVWERLAGRLVLGCNEAFRLHAQVPIAAVFFSDARWFVKRCRILETYCEQGGSCFTHEEPMRFHNLPWLHVLPRRDFGLHLDGLGFGHNSGCGAINLALLLGAARVFLLGFDCKTADGTNNPGPQQNNWHEHYAGHNHAKFVPPFAKFDLGFRRIAKDLPTVFPGREVINLNPDSALECFPKVALEEYVPEPLGYVP